MFFEWLQVISFSKSPEELLEENPTLIDSFKRLIVASVISSLVSLLNNLLFFRFFFDPLWMIVSYVFFSLVGVIFLTAVLHLLARLAGGKGEYSLFLANQARINAALIGVGSSFISLVLIFLNVFGIINQSFVLPVALFFLLVLVAWYLTGKNIAAVYQLPLREGILVTLVLALVLVIAFFALTWFGLAVLTPTYHEIPRI